MKDDQVNLSPSFTGHNENESESNRNSMEKGTNSEHQNNPKNFMAPTISTSSKSMTLKKKILAEWTESSPNAHLKKPSKNLGHSTKMGTSNSSSNPKNCLPKIPNSESLRCNEVVKFEDDESFVPDNSTMPPYDPLTNYLSPRPKFLRYNPNRRREAVVLSQVEEGSRSRSRSSRSRASTSYSTAESCMKLEMSDDNEDSEKEEVVVVEGEVEEEEEEEEDMVKMGEGKSGLKWELLKGLIVLVVLVFFTMYISSMNNNSIEPTRGLEVEYQEFGNNSFRGVSLTRVELGDWVFTDVKEESEIDMFEFSEMSDYVASGGNLSRQTIEMSDYVASGGNLSRQTIEMSDYVEDQDVRLAGRIEISENYYRNVSRVGDNVSTNPIPKSLVIEDMIQEETLVNEDMIHEENDVSIVMNSGSDLKSNEDIIQEETLVDGKEPNSNDGQLTNEVEFVAKEAPRQEIDAEEVELESKSKDDPLENEVEIVSEDQVLHQEIESEEVVLQSKSKDEELGNEVEIVPEDQNEMIEEEEFSDPISKEEEPELVESPIKEVEAEDEKIIENGDDQWWVKLKNVLCFVIPLMMTWVASLVVSFYHNCKKASSKTISSTKPVVFEKSISRLPPRSGDKITHTQKTIDPHSNPPPTVVHSTEEKLEKSPSRFIPKVQMLSEYEVAGEFMRRCDLGSKFHEDNEHSIHTVPEESKRAITKAKAAPKMAFSSPAPSHSVISTCDSQDGKEEVSKRTTETPTTLRRSSRLRSKGVQSP